MKYSALTDEKRKSNEEYISSVRTHLAKEHKRWGDSLFKLFTLSNTGGIVLVASFISSVQEFRSSYTLRVAMTFYVFGLITNLIAVAHEFTAIKKELDGWDAGKLRYKNDEITLDEYHRAHALAHATSRIDELIIWAPAYLFLAGCIPALFFLFKQ